MNPKDLKEAINETVDLLLRLETQHSQEPILKSNDPEEVKDALDHHLPSKSSPLSELLSSLEQEVIPYLNRNTDPRFAAYITGSGNYVSAIAEFIKSYFNQNALKWNNSPIANEMEQLIIKWVAEFIGLPQFNQGVLTSGGSMSNLLALHFALASKYPQREMEGFYHSKKLVVYCSDQTHSSIERAMVFLGLGRSYLRKISVDRNFKIDLEELNTTISKDINAGLQPFALIGNAGTTNTGSIDDLKALASVAKEYDLWYHVDGAYGLPARNLPKLRAEFNGVELADSVIINPHKWMYVPFEASCILLKDIPKAIHFDPDYLYTANKSTRWESSEHTIELSKEFKALKVWFTLKYYGTDKLSQFVAHDIELTNYLAELLSSHDHIEVEPNHALSIVCFRYKNEELSDEQNESLNQKAVAEIENAGDIFITGTKLRGKTYLRAYFGNPNRTQEDVDYMKDVILKTIAQICS